MLEITYEHKDDIGTFYTLPIKTSQLYIWKTDSNINIVEIRGKQNGQNNKES